MKRFMHVLAGFLGTVAPVVATLSNDQTIPHNVKGIIVGVGSLVTLLTSLTTIFNGTHNE